MKMNFSNIAKAGISVDNNNFTTNISQLPQPHKTFILTKPENEGFNGMGFFISFTIKIKAFREISISLFFSKFFAAHRI